MSFNVWYGGASIDPAQITAAIEAAGADVVGIQEPEGNLRRIAEAAGLSYVDEGLHLISRYPLFAAGSGDVRFAYVAIDPTHVAAVANMHLLCCPYGPNLAAAGKTADEVLELERRTRLPEIEPYAEHSASSARRACRLFSPATSTLPPTSTGPKPRSRPAISPTHSNGPPQRPSPTRGFRDSYRDAHPDPAGEPGLTWTAGQPPPRMRPGRDQRPDRLGDGRRPVGNPRLAAGRRGGRARRRGRGDAVGQRSPRRRLELRDRARSGAISGLRLRGSSSAASG